MGRPVDATPPSCPPSSSNGGTPHRTPRARGWEAAGGQSAAACLEWLAATTTTPPPPPPSVPTDAVRDLEAVAAQLAETARDTQAAGLMVGTVIQRLRAGGGSGA